MNAKKRLIYLYRFFEGERSERGAIRSGLRDGISGPRVEIRLPPLKPQTPVESVG